MIHTWNCTSDKITAQRRLCITLPVYRGNIQIQNNSRAKEIERKEFNYIYVYVYSLCCLVNVEDYVSPKASYYRLRYLYIQRENVIVCEIESASFITAAFDLQFSFVYTLLYTTYIELKRVYSFLFNEMKKLFCDCRARRAFRLCKWKNKDIWNWIREAHPVYSSECSLSFFRRNAIFFGFYKEWAHKGEPYPACRVTFSSSVAALHHQVE